MTNGSKLSCALHAKPVASQGEHRLATLSISCAFEMLSYSFRLVRLKVSRCPGFTCWPTRRLLASSSQSQRLRAAYTRASTRTVQPLYTSELLDRAPKTMIRCLSLGSLHFAAARSRLAGNFHVPVCLAQPYTSESKSSTTMPAAHDLHNNYHTNEHTIAGWSWLMLSAGFRKPQRSL